MVRASRTRTAEARKVAASSPMAPRAPTAATSAPPAPKPISCAAWEKRLVHRGTDDVGITGEQLGQHAGQGRVDARGQQLGAGDEHQQPARPACPAGSSARRSRPWPGRRRSSGRGGGPGRRTPRAAGRRRPTAGRSARRPPRSAAVSGRTGRPAAPSATRSKLVTQQGQRATGRAGSGTLEGRRPRDRWQRSRGAVASVASWRCGQPRSPSLRGLVPGPHPALCGYWRTCSDSPSVPTVSVVDVTGDAYVARRA